MISLEEQMKTLTQRLEQLEDRLKILEVERHCERERTNEQAERTA